MSEVRLVIKGQEDTVSLEVQGNDPKSIDT